MRYIFFVFLFLVFSGFSLKEKLSSATGGDFVVTFQNKTYTLLLVKNISEGRVVIEEISIPQEVRKKQSLSWREWIANNAPAHSSWLALEIDLGVGHILQCYSFDDHTWIEIPSEESFFSTLLHLPLTLLPEDKRKRIGPPPLQGEVDHRSLWIPPLVIDGKSQEKKEFEIFEGIWPADQTELSSKRLELYFDRMNFSPFPFWMEVDAGHLSLVLRGVDMGKNLVSPQKELSFSLPRFVGREKIEKKELLLFVESPSFYKNFSLYAIEAGSSKELIPLNFHLTKEKNLSIFALSLKDLEKTLQKEHLYYWVLLPEKKQELSVSSKLPFLWNPSKEK
jgi:hypothetical protein